MLAFEERIYRSVKNENVFPKLLASIPLAEPLSPITDDTATAAAAAAAAAAATTATTSIKNHIASSKPTMGCAAIVLERLGISLDAMNLKHFGSMPLPMIIVIGYKMLNCIEALHSYGIVHRDLKLDNFMFGRGPNSGNLYLIDFGLSKSYLSSMGTHVPFEQGKAFIGNVRYASINCHRGLTFSRRDDIQSMLYILAFLICGSLPWQTNIKIAATAQLIAPNTQLGVRPFKRSVGVTKDATWAGVQNKSKNIRGHDSVREMKTRLCTGNLMLPALPIQLYALLNYTSELGFYDRPDYNLLRQCMLQIYHAIHSGYCGTDCKEFQCGANNFHIPTSA